MRLLEREHLLEELTSRAGRAFAGRGSVVLMAGEAGIGKTAVLRALVDRTPAKVQSLWGCATL